MTSRFMMSVAAAALIAGTGFANAQGTMGHEGAAGAPAEKSAPAATGKPVAPAGRTAAEPMAPSTGMKATQSEQKPAGATNQRAEDNMQGQKPNSMHSETSDGAKGKDMKAEGNGMKPEGNGMKPEGRDGNMNADSKGAADGKTQTTGQAGAGAKMSSDQRTRISSVIREQHIAPVTNVNFSISVGTRIPRDVEFHPLPTEIVTIYPEWRGYEFILVGEQIVVVDPRTFEIVAVLDA
jgi:Protein of unknown function (DUF1236)